MQKNNNINMYIHFKNIKKISKFMQEWTHSNVSHYGITECHYAKYDLKQNLWFTMPCIYDWYCEYIENSFDTVIHERLVPGFRYWHNSDPVFQNYRDYNNQTKSIYKCDLVLPTRDGYEMIVIACRHILSKFEITQVEKALHYFSYESHKLTKNKKNLFLNLNEEVVKKLGINSSNFNHEKTSNTPYLKSKFDTVTLTAKEQKYIEYMLFNFTYKQIAYAQSCSEMAVRKVILNVKRKLGCEYMSTSQMMVELNKLGVLSVCSQSFKGT